MTKNRTYALTAASAALFALLCWVFADGLFTKNFWNGEDIAGSAIWTYVMLTAIIAAGLYQARRLPEGGVDLRPASDATAAGQIDDPVSWKLLLGNTFFALVWLPVRFFVGREWVAAGEHKLRDDAWMGGGGALKGYWERATAVPEGRPAAPAGTYAWFEDLLGYMLRHEWYTWFAKVIAVGEFLIGIGLIVGALVGIAAFFGTLMNFNFQLAGTASTNPVLFGLGVFLVLAWKVAGYWGLDRVLLAAVGTPWTRGRLFSRGDEIKAQPRQVLTA
ncbi:MAG: thiosulfate dehydrogenase (quinone) large subunit [Thermomicrobiales bacterium]|nr:thiosulfate dehydrogenase (quinone) large subunit [Thermomicrobiales bacterium]